MSALTILLKVLQLLAMTVWVGGLIFFAFVLAPTAFHVLPRMHDAGLIVGASLKVFDNLALGCGVVFLMTTALLRARSQPPRRHPYLLQLMLACGMFLATAYLQWSIIPAMDEDQRLSGGDINTLAPGSAPRVHFDSLHHRSETVAGGILLLGAGSLVLLALHDPNTRQEKLLQAKYGSKQPML